MRLALGMVGIAVVCLSGGPALAADLPVKAQKEAVVREAPVAAERVCLKWVNTTYSWYNYCDPVPTYSRHRYDGFAGLF
jgi:hypothetical protein